MWLKPRGRVWISRDRDSSSFLGWENSRGELFSWLYLGPPCLRVAGGSVRQSGGGAAGSSIVPHPFDRWRHSEESGLGEARAGEGLYILRYHLPLVS